MNSKNLILYAYYESKEAARNLSFFMKYGIPSKGYNNKFVIIINGFRCSINDDDLMKVWDGIIRRENKNLDFGAWSEAINQLKGELKEYDKYFFINSTVIGPFFPRWLNVDVSNEWINVFSNFINDKIKLAGISINYYFGKYFSEVSKLGRIKFNETEIDFCHTIIPHVQSMFMVTDSIGLEIANRYNLFDISSKYLTKNQIIACRELALSHFIRLNGFEIDCILPLYHGKNYDLKENLYINVDKGGYPWVDGGYQSRTIHPYESIFFKTTHKPNEKILNSLIKELAHDNV